MKVPEPFNLEVCFRRVGQKLWTHLHSPLCYGVYKLFSLSFFGGVGEVCLSKKNIA